MTDDFRHTRPRAHRIRTAVANGPPRDVGTHGSAMVPPLPLFPVMSTLVVRPFGSRGMLTNPRNKFHAEMTNWSLSKWKPVINLSVRSHTTFALHLLDMLELHHGGRVEFQKDLLYVLHLEDRITNGAAYEMIEHLAARGYLRIERWGPGDHYKRIVLVAWPGRRDAHRIRTTKTDWPIWATEYFAGPPNHRHHLRRHRDLLANPPRVPPNARRFDRPRG